MDSKFVDAIKPLKSLNSDQMDKCVQAARQDVKRHLGEKPERLFYLDQISLKASMMPNDYFGIVLFFVLLLISLIHMLTFTGKLAKDAFDNASAGNSGIFLQIQAWVVAHQLTFFAFSELGVLFFYIRHVMGYLRWRDEMIAAGRAEEVEKSRFRRWLSVSSLAAFACAVVAIIANVTSLTYGAGNIETTLVTGGIGVLIPVLTLFLGERAAEILMDYMYARERAEKTWRASFDRWTLYNERPEQFDEGDRVNSYRKYLANRIVEYYKLYIEPKISPRLEWTPEIELALAGREMARLRRMENLDAAEAFFTQPPRSEAPGSSSETTSLSGSQVSSQISSNGRSE